MAKKAKKIVMTIKMVLFYDISKEIALVARNVMINVFSSKISLHPVYIFR